MNQKVCVITGIGPGLGIAYARRFSEGGYCVALLGRTREKLERYAEEISGSLAVVCDVSDSGSVASAFQTVRAELGDPTVVVHNAGSQNRCHTSFGLLNKSGHCCLAFGTVLNVRRSFSDIHN